MYQMRIFTALTPDQLEKVVNSFLAVNQDIEVVSIQNEKMDIYFTCSMLFKILG